MNTVNTAINTNKYNNPCLSKGNLLLFYRDDALPRGPLRVGCWPEPEKLFFGKKYHRGLLLGLLQWFFNFFVTYFIAHYNFDKIWSGVYFCQFCLLSDINKIIPTLKYHFAFKEPLKSTTCYHHTCWYICGGWGGEPSRGLNPTLPSHLYIPHIDVIRNRPLVSEFWTIFISRASQAKGYFTMTLFVSCLWVSDWVGHTKFTAVINDY